MSRESRSAGPTNRPVRSRSATRFTTSGSVIGYQQAWLSLVEETSILPIVSAAGGMALAVWGFGDAALGVLRRLAFVAMVGADRIELDRRVLAFTLSRSSRALLGVWLWISRSAKLMIR